MFLIEEIFEMGAYFNNAVINSFFGIVTYSNGFYIRRGKNFGKKNAGSLK